MMEWNLIKADQMNEGKYYQHFGLWYFGPSNASTGGVVPLSNSLEKEKRRRFAPQQSN